MKRLQIYIEEDLDEALATRALHEGTSKAALIRQFVKEKLERAGGGYDPMDELVGHYDQEPRIIDEVVYGP